MPRKWAVTVSILLFALFMGKELTMANYNLPESAPAFLGGEAKGTAGYEAQLAKKLFGKHRIKNDRVKLNSNMVQKRTADYNYRMNHPDLYLQQPPATTPTTTSNPTPGQSTGGGQGQNVRFNQKTSKFDRNMMGPSSTPVSDQLDAISESRNSGATTTPKPTTGGGPINAVGSVGPKPPTNPFAPRTPSGPFAPSTPPAWSATPAPFKPVVPSIPGVVYGPPAQKPTNPFPYQGAPKIPAYPGAPTIPAPVRPVIPGVPQPAPTRPALPLNPPIPSNVMQGGGFANGTNGARVYIDPLGRRYFVAPDGRFMPSTGTPRTLVGGADFGTGQDQYMLAQLARARAMSEYLQPNAMSGGSTFGSYYGGGFGGGGRGGGGGGGGGGGYDGYDSYPTWYTDLAAWNIG